MKNLVSLVFLTLVFLSCQKNVKNDLEVIIDNYLPLEIGNYWIYNVYKTDSLGNEIASDIYDSVVVVQTEWINGNEYFLL